jgi:hypothetical protein
MLLTMRYCKVSLYVVNVILYLLIQYHVRLLLFASTIRDLNLNRSNAVNDRFNVQPNPLVTGSSQRAVKDKQPVRNCTKIVL